MSTQHDQSSDRDRSKPTWDNQLWHARRLYHEKGADALNNPHAMIGRTCGCGTCFCCAALKVYRDHLSGRGVESAI